MDKNETIDEMWVDIKNYEGIYQVSSLGRVKKLYREWFGGNGGLRFTGEKIFEPHYSKFGYNHLSLNKDGGVKDFRVCRLVCAAFHPNSENKPFVNHKDGNKANDREDNLEWNTRSENDLHAYKNGLRTPMKGSLNGMATITEDLVKQIRAEYKGERTYHKLAQKFGLRNDHIGNIVRRDIWKHV